MSENLTPVELPTDRPRRARVGSFATAERAVAQPLVQSLRVLAEREQSSLFALAQTAFLALLHRYCGQSEIAVASLLPDEKLVAARARFSETTTLGELLKARAESPLAAAARSDLLQLLVAGAPLPKVPEQLVRELAASARVEAASLTLSVAYASDLFDAETIERMLRHWEALLAATAQDLTQRAGEIELVIGHERELLVRGWNDTAVELPPGLCVHHMFEAQVARTPDSVAVVFAEGTLTYRELDRRAEHLAQTLRSLGVVPDAMVGLCVERSLEMAVGLLAILKAGGAYVPMDPAYPADRLAFMLSDTQAPVLLTQRSVAAGLPAHSARTVFLDEYDFASPRASVAANAASVTPDHIAYVIYTSGSTGRPKGICLGHRPLVNLLRWHDRTLLRGARTLQFASLSFDASFHEMFAAWSSGGSVYLISEAVRRDVAALTRFIAEHAIEKVILPVVVLQQMAEHFGDQPELFRSLRELTTTGEQLHVTTPIVRLFKQLKGCSFHNHYGPSETHVVTALTLNGDPESWPTHPSIGRPIDNTQLYVLDRHGRLVPRGVVGELYLGGVSLARCYHGRPELTRERFVADPFSSDPTARLYKTGDLARWLPDGNMEFLGRIDHQVKIRGFRVELGEVEGTLSKHPAVKEAVVIAREDAPGDRRLVAYVVPEARPAADAATPVTATLRSHLREQLPEFMLPSAIVLVEAMPLTPNGKVDRRALPAPSMARPELREPFVAPRSEAERELAEIWRAALALDRVGVLDNFFELGGDSLRAVQVFARVRQRFGVNVSFQQLFSKPTVAALAELIGASASTPLAPIARVARSELLPLSFAQERLWFLQRLAPESTAYNCSYFFRLRGPVDHHAMHASLRALVARHEILRTTFVELRGQPLQEIHSELDVPLELSQLEPLSGAEAEAALARFLNQQVGRPFDLARGPLLRTGLVRTGVDEHVFWMSVHHIVTDGRSMEVIFRELALLYAAARRGEPLQLPANALQYVDYAAWQRRELSEQTLRELAGWWAERLRGAPALLELPTDFARGPAQSFRGRSVQVELGAELTEALRALGKQNNMTLVMVVLAGFAALLQRHAGQSELVIGIPSLGRDRVETEELVGFFVNTLPIRLDFSAQPSFAELLEQVRRASLEAFEHDALPFERLVQELKVERVASHNPLIQVALAPQPPGERELALAGLGVEHLEVETQRAAFDLTLFCRESPEGLSGTIEYRTDLFKQGTIERLVAHLRTLLTAAAAEPGRKTAALPILSEAERNTLLVEWNDTARPRVTDRCFHELFAEQALRTPDAIAVEEPSGRALTYAALDEQANRLAVHLRALGVKPDAIVGLCVERSLELVVGVLGIMKAGGAYVPLDPTYPRDRLELMLADAAPVALVTQSHLEALLPAVQTHVVRLDTDAARIAQHPGTALSRLAQPHHLAYVIYTSGSTGRPKGAMLEHRSLVNMAEAQRLGLEMTPDARVLQFASLSFDAAVWEMATTLTIGATLCMLPPGRPLVGLELGRFLRDHRITVATLPPSVLPDVPAELATGVTTLVVAGEACSAELASAWASGRRFINAYGPTECTVCATLTVCSADGQAPSIGRPLANVRAYVLDDLRNPVPVGVPGELYVGGAGVARGYLHRAELTAERFLADPFAAEPGARMYRTGDLVRYREDGQLDFLGRRDHQVKVRGFRVELGEIEAALREHPGVHDVAVIARPVAGGERRLVAYVVRSGEASHAPELREFLERKLPGYMVPADFVTLDALPLSPTGKVDREALPAPSASESAASRTYVAPRSDIEKSIAAIWSELLGGARVGAHDNFFDLGGHSLLVSRVIFRIHDALGIELPMRTLYEAPTVAEVARCVEQGAVGESAIAHLCYTPTLVLEEEARLDDSIRAREPVVDLTKPARHIFLTGATGFVGAHLLAELLAKGGADIHCLVRARSTEQALDRLRVAFETYKLPVELLSERVHPVLGDLGSERLGLDVATFAALAGKIDLICHNGAKVDHVRGYLHMKPANVLGTQEVLRLACLGRVKPVHFVSTLGVVYPADYAASGVIYEDAPAGPLARLPNGYMQSKCVAEHMVMEARQRGIPTAIYRLGAVSGHSETGECNPADYTYSALRSTIELGFADDLDTDLTLTPIDYVARALAALMGRAASLGKTHHITNPRLFSWLQLVASLNERGFDLRIVSYAECMRGLLDAGRRGTDTPFLAFLPFATQRLPGSSHYIVEDYYAFVRWDCTNSAEGLREAGVAAPPFPEHILDTYLEYLERNQLLRTPKGHVGVQARRSSDAVRRTESGPVALEEKSAGVSRSHSSAK